MENTIVEKLVNMLYANGYLNPEMDEDLEKLMIKDIENCLCKGEDC